MYIMVKTNLIRINNKQQTQQTHNIFNWFVFTNICPVFFLIKNMTSARKTPLLKQDEPNIMKNVCRFCLSTDDEINRTSKWSRLEVGNLYREVTGNELIDLKLITNEGYCNACLVRLRHSAESLRMFKEAERVWTVIVGKAEESKHVIFVDEVYKKCIFKDTIVTKLEINECIEEKSDFVFVDVNDSENDGFLEDPIEGYCEAYECFECHKVFKCRWVIYNIIIYNSLYN